LRLRRRPWYHFKIAHYNFGDGHTSFKVNTLKNLAGSADIIVCSEGWDRHDAVKEFLVTNRDWAVAWFSDSHADGECFVLYHKGLKLEEFFVALVKIGFLGPHGAGGDHPGHKGLAVAKFKFPNGATCKVAVHHVIPSWTRMHLPGGETKRRRAAAKRQLKRFFGIRGLAVIAGDQNGTRAQIKKLMHIPVRWKFDDYPGADFGHRQITLFWHSRSLRLQKVKSGTMHGASDHLIVWEEYRVR
jgi:hypothetical protein